MGWDFILLKKEEKKEERLTDCNTFLIGPYVCLCGNFNDLIFKPTRL